MRRGTILALVFLLSWLGGCRSEHDGRLVVGSKNFTEQIVLAELLAQLVEARGGVDVQRRVNLGGTLLCHQAIRAGQIDLYVEYTGTALTAVLGEKPAGNAAEVLGRVREEYARRFGLRVGEPLGFENTFAIVVRGDAARQFGLKTISDLARHAPGWRAGFGYEFMERPDGFKGLASTYKLRFNATPRIMELGLLYRALKENQVDVVAGNSTDGVIAALDLVALEDDRGYFPPYQAVPVVRWQVLERLPGLREALGAIAGKISAEEMRRLNYAVDGEQRDVKAVVGGFLRSRGWVSP